MSTTGATCICHLGCQETQVGALGFHAGHDQKARGWVYEELKWRGIRKSFLHTLNRICTEIGGAPLAEWAESRKEEFFRWYENWYETGRPQREWKNR